MKTFNKKILFFFFLYLTLLIGFFLNENSSGGAIHDFQIISKAIIAFSINFDATFENFNDFNISHFPYYYIFLSYIFTFFGNVLALKFLVLHLSLLLPIIFYKIISIRFDQKNPYLIYLPGILFLSVYFRSNAIWALNDNIALIFFSLAIYFYLKVLNEKPEKRILIFSLLNLFALILASYTRQYYAVFWLFFAYKIFILFEKKIILIYLIISLILSLPAINAVFNTENLSYSTNFLSKNLFNNLIIIPTIFTIYLLPLYFNKENIKKIFSFYKKNFKYSLVIIFLTFFLMQFFDYSTGVGGGVLFKISYYENFLLFFYLVLFVSFLINFYFIMENFKENMFIYLILIMMFQVNYIYQKYLDPLSFILLFCIFKSDMIKNLIKNLKDDIKYLYLYFFCLYCGSFIYYYI
ncbi:hypothetical protein VP91_00001950 [Candidatus Pelagibacter ubique]|uniref:Glycosyltransferase RgtA/B/C/D-like domain-containing protein n=1 Tax=Pelagibacter ubique TaxID=198252 RepID=A0ABX1SYZ7_PELUQ|nr:hypothetical protein [Candidatus Pelagibacter ubique]NMN67062.1 hypothetical protein [Candidatus Pelagibacter ubique]